MKINKAHIENFTVFQRQDLEFCPGVNVIIGANGTGKSHLLKILYAMTQRITSRSGGQFAKWLQEKEVAPPSGRIRKDESGEKIEKIQFVHLLNGVFKPEGGEIGLLLRNRLNGKGYCSADCEFESHIHERYVIGFIKDYLNYDASAVVQAPNAKGVFIPPNEVLAIYPGFAASYEKRELAFDQTYYDLCRALSAAPLKTNQVILSRLKLSLEEILQGKVVQRGDHFYIQGKKSERTLEAHLLAEGHRKIAALVHLINNGSIDKDTILFWDEPEASMNPQLIRHIAIFLRELAKIGIQVFIATHDYLLTGELSLAAEYQTQPRVPIRFFAMSREGDDPVDIQCGDTLADLQDNPILDEFAAHYQREQQAVLEFMRKGAAS